MLIKLTNGQPENYTIGQLRRDNPQVSFPSTIPEHILTEYGVYRVVSMPVPEYDHMTHSAKDSIELVDGGWTRVWTVEPLPLEQAESNIRRERDRLLAESDWIVSRSYEQGIPVPAEWAIYRQVLRDIPSQSRFPYDVVWPTANTQSMD